MNKPGATIIHFANCIAVDYPSGGFDVAPFVVAFTTPSPLDCYHDMLNKIYWVWGDKQDQVVQQLAKIFTCQNKIMMMTYVHNPNTERKEQKDHYYTTVPMAWKLYLANKRDNEEDTWFEAGEPKYHFSDQKQKMYDDLGEATRRVYEHLFNQYNRKDHVNDERERLRREQQERAKNQQNWQRTQTFVYMGNGKTAHSILFVTKDAPKEVVQAAYKALSRLYHPDNGGSSEQMIEINQAYDSIKKGW